MPFLYGYLQFSPTVTKGVCWSCISLNVALFVMLYVLQIQKIKDITTEWSFHAHIMCMFLSSSSLFLAILIYSHCPSAFVMKHKLFDFTVYPFIGIGVLSSFNALVLLFSQTHFTRMQTLIPSFYYGGFLWFYLQSCLQCMYFLYLVGIPLCTFIMGMACNHKPFDADSVAVDQQITSLSNPLKVDFLETDPFDRVGMTMLPGRKKSVYNRDLEADLKRLRLELNVQALVTLIPRDELLRCQCQDILDIANGMGLETLYFPWRDKFIPNDIEAFHVFICRLQQYLQSNRRIVIHCNGGVGRTGTATACLIMKVLKENGNAPDDIRFASQLMRRARRPNMLKNPLQPGLRDSQILT